ncbi:hypothetical protein AV521_23770 [Streptomyces sp. IMTB 2501]|uniref:hypothetical protein n=1 Tax=Streptomyces sp. IMTB 2501 TaxID=1776340 RepID=UPI00096C73F1|nr:hypothetical protein [Streptomyces sp. IMTB 2501]OLZ67401.1 hypothetical protein AV521_23770 [Streptomyces sp. IMTB 2501]
MFRGTTARTRFALLAVLLLALQLFAPTATFTSAHTLSDAQAKAGPVLPSSVPPVREDKDSIRTPCRPGLPVSTPHLRDRQRGSASCRAQQPEPISGRTAAADAPDTPGAPRPHTERTSRAHTPSALQVFRC